MPKSSKVHKMYEAIKEEEMRKGMPAKKAAAKAARISQSKTKRSLKTGKKLKRKKK